MFVTFGVPVEISSDGGPEFKAQETKDFLNRWGVRHRLSSAYHASSNGRAELAVKSTKRLLVDNIGPGGDLNTDKVVRALLMKRNTPDPDCKLSPAEVIFGRKIRDTLPYTGLQSSPMVFENKGINPMWREAWSQKEEALRQRYMKQLEKLESGSRLLLPLRHGERVFVQNQAGRYGTKWDKSGTIVETHPNDQYTVKIDGSGRLSLRNRQFLRKITSHELFGGPQPHPAPPSPPVWPETTESHPPPLSVPQPANPGNMTPPRQQHHSPQGPPAPLSTPLGSPMPSVHQSPAGPATPDSLYGTPGGTPRQLRFDDEARDFPNESPARQGDTPVAGPNTSQQRPGILKRLANHNEPGRLETPFPTGRTTRRGTKLGEDLDN